jgi:glycine betaine/choline ABC-type transport system substrate-binding protein
LTALLNSLAGQINDSIMREMNYEVDKGGKSSAQVARKFLKDKGLLPETGSE